MVTNTINYNQDRIYS